MWIITDSAMYNLGAIAQMWWSPQAIKFVQLADGWEAEDALQITLDGEVVKGSADITAIFDHIQDKLSRPTTPAIDLRSNRLKVLLGRKDIDE